jgi:hypothetical protein
MTTYTLAIRVYILQITYTHSLVSQSIRVSTRRYLTTDFNTGTVTVSLNYTLQITHKIFSSKRDFQWSSLATN